MGELKNGITTVVGAALGEQECWEKTACKAGEYAASLPGKDVLFIVLDRLVPSSWVETLDSVKQSATYEQNCNRYECSADPEGTETMHDRIGEEETTTSDVNRYCAARNKQIYFFEK